MDTGTTDVVAIWQPEKENAMSGYTHTPDAQPHMGINNHYVIHGMGGGETASLNSADTTKIVGLLAAPCNNPCKAAKNPEGCSPSTDEEHIVIALNATDIAAIIDQAEEIGMDWKEERG